MKNFFKGVKEEFDLLRKDLESLVKMYQKPKNKTPHKHVHTDWDGWAEHGVLIENVFGGETMQYKHEYFAIVSMKQFLMKGETKFFHDLAHAQLFNSRAEAGKFMREWKISGCVIRVTCEFTAHGV